MLVVLGLIIRCVFLPAKGFQTDISTFEAWATSLVEGGVANFYTAGGLHDNGFSVYAAAGRAADAGKDGKFKVPTLRHLFLTAPYGHHGEVGTLASPVCYAAEIDPAYFDERKA